MKHIKRHISLFIALLLTVGLMAQERTTATIIADALAQLPAETPEQYEQVMTDLVQTGEEGLNNLIGRINAPGPKSNEAVDFALDGWVNFVANDDALRSVAANTLEQALSQPLHDEIKASLIRQLTKIGSDDNVAGLNALLGDKRLAGPASRALVAIGRKQAKQLLVTALNNETDVTLQTELVNAIGQTQYQDAEGDLLQLLAQNKSPQLNQVIHTALAQLGGVNSLSVLKQAAQAGAYTYNGKDDQMSDYLRLLSRLSTTQPKVVQKEVKGLLKLANKTNNRNLQVAASQLMLAVPSANSLSLLKGALKGDNLQQLTGILESGQLTNNKKLVKLVTKQLSSKASPDKQTALLYWLGNNKVESAVVRMIPFATSSNPMVQRAAIASLAQIDNNAAMMALAGLLKSNDQQTVEMAQAALSTFSGDVATPLADMYAEVGNAGKVAILQLLSDRKSDSQYALVYNELSNDNDVVKAAAADALRHVVTTDNLDDLFALLEQVDKGQVAAIQQAINPLLGTLSAEEQLALVNQKMLGSSNKHLYYSMLANSQSQQAMEVIIDAYEKETGVNKAAAFEALTNWGSFEAIYPMLDIARESNDKQELKQLTDALIKTIVQSKETGAIKYLYLREAMELAQNNEQKNNILKHIGNTGLYQAMLYVAPFMDNPALSEEAALAAMNIALSNNDFAGELTTEILNKVSRTLANPDAEYQRQSITKYLNENEQSGGYVSMFNGKNLDGWKGLVANPIQRAKMTPRQLAAAQKKADEQMALDWKVEEGLIIFDGQGFDNLCTEKQYGDFEMLVDWKLFDGPEPDAGIYLRGTPQVQVWDTARVAVGAQVGSGGLYNNQKHMSKPLKVADQKVGEWNTFRIRMVGERVSVWLNGELVTDNVVLENFWDRSQPIFPVEQIELQAHGSKVAYRDIYIKEIERPEPFTLSKEEQKEGYQILFDGTNLDQWVGNKQDYVVESGNIVLYPDKSFGGNLYTTKEFDNFVFRFEFMLTPGANNGLGIRTPTEGDAAYVGMELQILDDDAPIYAELEEYQYHGSVYGVIPAKRGHLKPLGEWNYQEVVADGDHIKITLNGEVIVDGNIREASKNGTIDGLDHPGLLNKSGHMGFLGHGSKVWFRNIRVKQL